jgi:hypothetical protein
VAGAVAGGSTGEDGIELADDNLSVSSFDGSIVLLLLLLLLFVVKRSNGFLG